MIYREITDTARRARNMHDHWWSDDDELLTVLAEALREKSDVPARFVEAGKAIFTRHPNNP